MSTVNRKESAAAEMLDVASHDVPPPTITGSGNSNRDAPIDETNVLLKGAKSFILNVLGSNAARRCPHGCMENFWNDLSPEWQSDRDVAMTALMNGSITVQDLPLTLRADRDFLLDYFVAHDYVHVDHPPPEACDNGRAKTGWESDNCVLLTAAAKSSVPANASSSANANHKRIQVKLRLDQVEAVRFPFKKKLMLHNLNLTAADLPMEDLCHNTPLGKSLHKLSLAGNNQLGDVPAQLVQSLPVLQTLDLSQCELHQLPDRWNLPELKRLNLSHNRLTEFPEEVSCHFCV